MFENCGSCLAAEQFVDIKLGTKDLLILTSYYLLNELKTSSNIADSF